MPLTRFGYIAEHQLRRFKVNKHGLHYKCLNFQSFSSMWKIFLILFAKSDMGLMLHVSQCHCYNTFIYHVIQKLKSQLTLHFNFHCLFELKAEYKSSSHLHWCERCQSFRTHAFINTLIDSNMLILCFFFLKLKLLFFAIAN